MTDLLINEYLVMAAIANNQNQVIYCKKIKIYKFEFCLTLCDLSKYHRCLAWHAVQVTALWITGIITTLKLWILKLLLLSIEHAQLVYVYTLKLFL